MKFKKIILMLVIGFFVLVGCGKKEKPKPNPEKPLPEVNERSISSVNDLTYDLFAYSFKEGENILLSPYSLYEAMAMLYNGAENDTAEGIKEFFGFFDKEENNLYIKNLRENLLTCKEIVSVSNAVYLKNGFSFSPRLDEEFIKPLTKSFGAEVHKIDFDSKAVDIINNWIKEKTNGLITKMIDEVPNDAIMYLINAVYFKGEWEYQFEEKNTSKQKFNDQMVDMMHMYNEKFLYYSDDDIQAIQLPYQDKYAMNIYLTKDGKYTDIDLKDITDKLDKSSKTEINKLALPKFTYETELILFNDYLSELDIFMPYTNLGIIANDIYVSRVMHKAKIIVNEQGTEAAAVTVIEVKDTAMPEPNNFIVDKSFVYTIVHKDTGTILFIGYMNEI